MKTGIGTRIRSLRTQAGLKQKELAERIDISGPTLSQIENGHRPPTYRQIEAIADVLQIPVRQVTEESDSGGQYESEPPPPSMEQITSMIMRYPRMTRLGKRTAIEVLHAFERNWELEESIGLGGDRGGEA